MGPTTQAGPTIPVVRQRHAGITQQPNEHWQTSGHVRGTARPSACSGAQAVVAAALRLLGALAAAPERAAALAANGTATRQLAAAGQLLARAVDVEAKYLARLEGAARAG